MTTVSPQRTQAGVLLQHMSNRTALLFPLQRWIKIVGEINKDNYSKRRVIFDILNEPDAVVRWQEAECSSTCGVHGKQPTVVELPC